MDAKMGFYTMYCLSMLVS